MRSQQSKGSAVAFALLAALLVPTARADRVTFIASTAAHEYAVRAYREIWDEYGERIISALETRTCLPFPETSVSAIVGDRVSNSGGPEHPMSLRASYTPEAKRSTLAHELGHRHLWQLSERLDDVDGHQTLFLVLDLVWQDVWGESFAEERVRGESGWRANYDYAAAWTWARSLAPAERNRLWRELLARNGFADECPAPSVRGS